MTPAESVSSFAINVLEDDNGRILLLKRRPQASLGPGLWGFPAGHRETGESPEECAMRELREEIGGDFSTDLVRYLGPLRDSFYGGIYEIHLFHRHWAGGRVVLNHEHTDYAWVSPEDFRGYKVMDGVDEDIHYLGIWPVEYLNADKLPPEE